MYGINFFTERKLYHIQDSIETSLVQLMSSLQAKASVEVCR